MTLIATPPTQRTFPAMLKARADGRPLVSAGDRSWTGQQALDVAAGRGASLLAAGIGRGDRVATLCGNGPEMIEMVLGCGWIGAVLVPINTAAMGPQIGYYLRDSGARLLVADAVALERIADAGSLPIERIWIVGVPTTFATSCPTVQMPGRSPGMPAAPVLPSDPFALLYTSGTTGPSKGVITSHAQYYWWGHLSAEWLELTATDVLCTTLPLFHINALNTLAQAMLTGAHMVAEARFSASAFWVGMAARGATVVYLLGAMLPILLARSTEPAERNHTIRLSLSPGAPAALMDAFTARTGVAIVDGYGSTETNFVIGSTAARRKPGFMGRVHPSFAAQIVDEHDNVVALGTPGELVIRAHKPFALSSGYFGMPDKTVEAWRNLWFHTGDRVVAEADGYFRFIDRLKDSIRRRGENISSHEVEQVLMSHSSVATAAVYAVPSDLAEDEVMAAIIPKDGPLLDPVELIQFCEPRLPYFAIPRFIEFLSDLPRTENGKIQKYRLRGRGVTDATWDRDASGYRLRRP